MVARGPEAVGGSVVGRSETRCGRDAGEVSLRGRNVIYTCVSQRHLRRLERVAHLRRGMRGRGGAPFR